MNYRSKSISLDDETWKAFDAAREVHGSYNKFLRTVLSAGGVFEANDAPGAASHQIAIATGSYKRPERPPLLKPSERQKGKG